MASGKESYFASAEDAGSPDWEDPLEKEMTTPPVFLPGKLNGPRSMVG